MGTIPLFIAANDPILTDRHGRRVNYLRLSITDLCNLRCFYCMPSKGVEKLPHQDVLRFEEFLEVTGVAASLGVTKVRITGGEPLIKRGAVKLVREIVAMPGIETVAMTTNGTRLEKYAEVLEQSGLSRVNVSLDSLCAETYASITRGGSLQAVLRGIDKALEVGFRVKINTVLVDGLNAQEAVDFVQFGLDKGVEIRFIEQMSFESRDPYVAGDKVLGELRDRFEVVKLPVEKDSTHVQLWSCDGVRVGFISPRSHPFCEGCNKLRLMPNGQLKACLAARRSVDMRGVLRRPHTDREVGQAIREAVGLKPLVGPWTARAEMWRVGG